MPEIHPTAIVDDAAELAPGVLVGPHCIIEGRVRIAEGTRLGHRVSLRGPLTIGRDNTIHPGACIGFEPQDRKFDAAHAGAGVTIGDRNVIREGVTIHRATGEHPTTLGHGNTLMPQSHVGHDARVGDHCTLGTGALLAGHARAADRAAFMPNSAVHQFCRVGRLARLQPNTGASQDIPPFCVLHRMRRVGGINADALERAGLARHIPALEQAYDIFYRRRHARGPALDAITEQLGDDPLCAEFAAFIRESQRGITAHAEGEPADLA